MYLYGLHHWLDTVTMLIWKGGGGCVMILKSWIGVVEATFTFAFGLFGECNIIVFNKVE